MVTDMFRIPRLAETADGEVVVTHWGHAAGTLFRGGDRLIFDRAGQDGLLVLRPKGWGNPMFGRRDSSQLLAVPSGAPASSIRWDVFGSVKAVERDFERGSIGQGRWFCAIRFEASDIATIARAKKDFVGGWLTSTELDALCKIAAVAPETHGVGVAIAASGSKEASESMLIHVGVGRLRFEARPIMQDAVTQGVVVPGPWAQIQATARHWTDRQVEYARVAPRRRMAVGAGSRVQLSLFGDSAPVDG